MSKRTHIYLSETNDDWLKKMEQKGVGKSSLVNLAIDILKPRLNNIQATETSIVETLVKKMVEERFPY